MQDGSLIELGDLRLQVRRPRAAAEAGVTLVVPVGATLVVRVAGAPQLEPAAGGRTYPRLRRGWALKRLDADEGSQRHVLRDLRGGGSLRLDDADAELVRLLDGSRSVAELAAAANARGGDAGAARLARLLAELADRGLLADVAPTRPPEDRPARAVVWPGAALFVDRLYAHGGFLAFTRAAYVLLAAVVLAGAAAFLALLAGDDATPLIVDDNLAYGAAIYVLGRLAMVAVHELAHALTLASFGRRVGAAGLRLVGPLPVAFADTSEAWFETQRRRLAVTAAGPGADAVSAGTAALVAVAVGAGASQDVLFQVALGAYLALLLNLNPLGSRDGGALLADRYGDAPSRARTLAAVTWVVAATAFVTGVAVATWARLDREVSEVALVTGWLTVYVALLVPGAVRLARHSSSRRAAPG